MLGIFVWGIGCVLVLIEFGVNITGLYATLGVGSVCSAMLIKESVSNIVAGVTIMLDRPFRVGDKVKLHTGDIGEIIKIGLRRTKVLISGEENSILIMPNKQLSNAKVYNYTFAKEIEG